MGFPLNRKTIPLIKLDSVRIIHLYLNIDILKHSGCDNKQFLKCLGHYPLIALLAPDDIIQFTGFAFHLRYSHVSNGFASLVYNEEQNPFFINVVVVKPIFKGLESNLRLLYVTGLILYPPLHHHPQLLISSLFTNDPKITSHIYQLRVGQPDEPKCASLQ